MRETYRRGLEHLAFSEDLYEQVARRRERERSGARRFWRAVAVVACVSLITLGTAFAANREFRSSVLSLLDLNRAEEQLPGQHYLVRESASGSVRTGVLTLPAAADFLDGVVYDDSGEKCRFFALTEDWQLQELPRQEVEHTITWQGETYDIHFVYAVYRGLLHTSWTGESPQRVGVRRGEDTRSVVLTLTGTEGEWPFEQLLLDLETLEVSVYGPGEEENALRRAAAEENAQIMRYVPGEQGGYLLLGGRDYLLNADGERIMAPEKGQPADWQGTPYWLGHESGTVYRLEQEQWQHVITGVDRMRWHSSADGLVVTGLSERGDMIVADVISGKAYELDGVDGEQDVHVYRKGENGKLVLCFGTLAGITEVAALDTGAGQLVRLPLAEEGLFGYVCGLLDDGRFAMVSYAAEGRIMRIYDFN